jgi:EAL domain-containing protein (putative c-di-GMP-specific phosphodiesterase class I)/GH25 family lysozyme M1 (1,4-beta-N-acetylmuramidase)
LAGFEALVRWRHPERGLIPPGEFIPLAEKSGLIHRIDLAVIDRACRLVQRARGAVPGGVFLSVNLSAHHFNDEAVVTDLQVILEHSGLPPERLKVEITESALIADPEHAFRVLSRIQDLGATIALDDFGTGYASLSYLDRFPIDVLKIDQSFVRALQSGGRTRDIVASVAHLAHKLRMDMVAEGIESADLIPPLRELGVQFGTRNRNRKALRPERQCRLRIERLEDRLSLNADIGEMTRTTAAVDVRTQPGLAAAEVSPGQYPFYRGSAPRGQLGSVVEGPMSEDGHTWWRVDFGPGKYAGWVTEDVLITTTIDYTRGIDVSRWQNQINWTSVKNFGIEFAFMKATESTDHVDPRFQQNVANSRNAGVLVGFYHFGHPIMSGDIVGDARAEAAQFVSVAGPHIRAPGLPPVLDLENRGLDGQPPNRAAISTWARAWLAEVERLTGVRPMIYSNSDWAKNYFEPDLKEYDLWHARWTRDLDQPPLATDPGIWSPNWTFWQYSDATLVPGVAAGVPGVLTGVDGDVFAGSLEDLRAWASEAVPDTIPPSVTGVSVTPQSASGGQPLTIRWIASDHVAVDRIGLFLYKDGMPVDTRPYANGGTVGGQIAADAGNLPNTSSYSWTVPATLPAASYQIKVVAWDAEGNASSDSPSLFSKPFSVFRSPLATITGSAADDSYYIRRDGTLLKVWESALPVGQPTHSIELADMNGTLTIDAGGGNDALTVNANIDLGLSRLIYNAGAGTNSLVVESGSARIDATATGGTLDTSVQVGAQLTTEKLDQHGLTLADAARVILLPGSGTNKLTSLSLGQGATLDITDNALVVDYTGPSPVAAIRDQIIAGRGGAGLDKPWNGAGMTSSIAAQINATAPNSYSLGYAENADLSFGAYTAFRGLPVDGTSVLIAYTRTGDANLDGVVNDLDVTILGATYAPGLTQPVESAWALGDFEYNGEVDDSDATLLGTFYDPAATPPPGPKPVAIDNELLHLLADAIAAEVAFLDSRKNSRQNRLR